MKVTFTKRKDGLFDVHADGKSYVCIEGHVRPDGALDLSIPLGQPQEAEDEFRTLDAPPNA